jgi:RecA-family ATPase
MDAIMAGQRRVIPTSWPILNRCSRALMPGKVTCISGDGGAGKTLFLSQCLVDWHQSIGIKACVYHLEDDRNYHLQRIHAQLAMESRITDHEWIEANPEWMKASIGRWGSDLAALGATIFESPDDQVNMEMMGLWVEARAKDGFDVIIIDPVTAIEAEGRPWITDLRFITKCKVVCRRYGCRVILVTHPRTGTKQGKATHNDMAGGAAYPRFAHTVLWVERNDAENEFAVDCGGLLQYLRPNRVLFISKARNGPGAGKRIAFNFSNAALRYEEIGIIEKGQQPCQYFR